MLHIVSRTGGPEEKIKSMIFPGSCGTFSLVVYSGDSVFVPWPSLTALQRYMFYAYGRLRTLDALKRLGTGRRWSWNKNAFSTVISFF